MLLPFALFTFDENLPTDFLRISDAIPAELIADRRRLFHCRERDAIQHLAIAHRHYGYHRIAALLRREGFAVNHKRVLRLMREDNLLCLRKRAFVPVTTDSRHGWRVVPNLARGMVTTGLDQLWVADITFIRLQEEFAFLAVVLDAFSRRVVGWALDTHLQASLAVDALEMAIAARGPAPGSLIQHSDRGVQYACGDYAAVLEAHGIQASMIGNPYCEADPNRNLFLIYVSHTWGAVHPAGKERPFVAAGTKRRVPPAGDRL